MHTKNFLLCALLLCAHSSFTRHSITGDDFEKLATTLYAQINGARSYSPHGYTDDSFAAHTIAKITLDTASAKCGHIVSTAPALSIETTRARLLQSFCELSQRKSMGLSAQTAVEQLYIASQQFQSLHLTPPPTEYFE